MIYTTKLRIVMERGGQNYRVDCLNESGQWDWVENYKTERDAYEALEKLLRKLQNDVIIYETDEIDLGNRSH